MTLPLTHPLTAEQALADAIAVEAAVASLAYWSVPNVKPVAAAAARDEAPVDLAELEQMYAYY